MTSRLTLAAGSRAARCSSAPPTSDQRRVGGLCDQSVCFLTRRRGARRGAPRPAPWRSVAPTIEKRALCSGAAFLLTHSKNRELAPPQPSEKKVTALASTAFFVHTLTRGARRHKRRSARRINLASRVSPRIQPETAVNRGRVRKAPTPGTLAHTHALRSSLERPYPRNSSP